MKFWQTKHFKTLQKDWYQRLKELGFQDEERLVNDDMMLKQFSERPFYRDNKNDLQRNARADYYMQLSQCVEGAAFKSEVDRIILTLFADGARMIDIYEELDKQGRHRCRMTIRATIKRYESLWGIRTHKKKEPA